MPCPDESLPSLTHAECHRAFAALFPDGFAGDDVRRELAPDGWDNSDLFAAFHPTVDKLWEESLAMHERREELGTLFGGKRRNSPPPTREEILRTWSDPPVDEITETIDIVCRCLWDIFSDNHDVIAADGRMVHLGSFRGSAGFLADMANLQLHGQHRDYMDYYMGTIWLQRRTSLLAPYRMIFRRLHATAALWRYSFPRLQVIRFDDADPASSVEEYSPSENFERERKRARDDAEHERLMSDLDEIHAKELAEARAKLPPETVQAHFDIFGRWPEGWPP